MTLNLKKHTLGVRILNHAITQALVAGSTPPSCRRPHPPGQTEPRAGVEVDVWAPDRRRHRRAL